MAAETFTLRDCLRESLAANHQLLARTAEGDAAQARADGRSAARRPLLFAQGSALHTDDPLRFTPATANNQPGDFTRNTANASLGIALPLYTGGKLTAEENAARLLAEAAAGDVAFTRQALAVRVVALYQDALAIREFIAALDQSRTTLAAQVERIDALIREEKAAGVDGLRVAVRLSTVEQAAIEARNRLAAAQSTITVLMGRPASSDWTLAGRLEIPGEEGGLREVARLQVRPDEAAAMNRAAAGEQRVRAAKAGYKPTISGVASVGSRYDFDHGNDENSGFVGLQMSWDIWDFDRTAAQVREAEANVRVLDEAAAETALQRSLEITNARDSVNAARARIDVSRLTVEQARESLRIEQRKYELGQGTITDVLDAQAAIDEAEALRARALADHAISLAARDFAAGTVFTSSAHTPALRVDPAPVSSRSNNK